jgi:hypothetical protein
MDVIVADSRDRGEVLFERYTEPARRAIFFARYTALRREAKEISTRNLILGMAIEHYPQPSPLYELNGKHEELKAALDDPPAK